MKITKSSRIRVSRDINKDFGLPWWEMREVRIKMREEYGMIFTSKRNNAYYFRPTDAQKYMLFIINFGNHVLKKSKHHINRF